MLYAASLHDHILRLAARIAAGQPAEQCAEPCVLQLSTVRTIWYHCECGQTFTRGSEYPDLLQEGNINISDNGQITGNVGISQANDCKSVNNEEEPTDTGSGNLISTGTGSNTTTGTATGTGTAAGGGGSSGLIVAVVLITVVELRYGAVANCERPN